MDQSFYTPYLPYISLVLGLTAIAFSILYASKKSRLKKTGICIDGIIFRQDLNNGFNQSLNISNRNKITVRFVTKKKEWITGEINQDFQFIYTGQYEDGETVRIYYDELNPSFFYVDSKQSEIIGRLLVALVGFGLLGYGIFNLIHR